MLIKLALLSYQDYLLEALSSLSREFDIDLVYSSTLGHKHTKKIYSLFPNCIIHDQINATLGKDPNGKAYDKDICCPSTLESIQKYEIEALSMLSRQEYIQGCFSFEKRRILFKKVAGFWESLFLTKKINLLILEEEPHIFSDYVGYIVAKALGIKVIFFSRITDGSKCLVFDSLEQDSEPIKLNLNNNDEKELIQKELSETWNIFRGDYKRSELFHLYDQKYKDLNEGSLKFLIKKKIRKSFNFTFEFIKRLYKYLTFNRKNKKLFIRSAVSDFKINRYGSYDEISYPKFLFHRLCTVIKATFLKKYYSRISQKEIKSKKYVFFALSTQPEKSTCPMGGLFDDQYYLCDLIIENLPDDWSLVIKEHKTQYYRKFLRWGFRRRSFKQYKKWKDNPKVELASIDYDTFKLIDNSMAVATVTGSIGLEAIARKKLVLAFGSPNYRIHNSLKKIKSKKDLQNIFSNINYHYEKNNLNADKNDYSFLEIISKNCIRGYVGGVARHESLKITENQNARSYEKFLKKFFKKFYSEN